MALRAKLSSVSRRGQDPLVPAGAALGALSRSPWPPPPQIEKTQCFWLTCHGPYGVIPAPSGDGVLKLSGSAPGKTRSFKVLAAVGLGSRRAVTESCPSGGPLVLLSVRFGYYREL